MRFIWTRLNNVNMYARGEEILRKQTRRLSRKHEKWTLVVTPRILLLSRSGLYVLQSALCAPEAPGKFYEKNKYYKYYST